MDAARHGRMTPTRTAKSCGPGAPTLALNSQRRIPRLAGDGGKQARFTEESTKETVKTIAQGMPVVPAVPVVLPRVFLLHAGHGCQPTPGIPCVLFMR
jgi:hypothetical protein